MLTLVKLTLAGTNMCNEKELKRIVNLNNKNKRRNQFLSSLKDKSTIERGRLIIKGYGYNPEPLCPESLNGCEGIEYGIDDILNTKEIPEDDPLNFKQVKPINKDYFSIDYRSNNFGISNVENDSYIFVKLMEFLPEEWYNKEVLLEKQKEGVKIKIKGILSEKNPDYLFFIRNTYDKHRNHIPEYSLVNAYLLPVEPLKLQVINYLNIIRNENDEKPLELENDIIKAILDIYQTWQLYDKRNYDFELLKVKDINKPDLFMKISKYNLLNYTQFNLNR